MNIKTEYINIIKNNNDNNNVIEIRFYYDLGGYDYFSYKEKKRGYYLSVLPMERKVKNGLVTERYRAFTGYHELLQPCNRKSKKAEAEATENLRFIKKLLVEAICKKYGYVVEV